MKKSGAKKIAAAMCSVVLLMGMTICSEAEDRIVWDDVINSGGEYVSRDYNSDSEISADDLVILRQALANGLTEDKYDVTGSSAVDIRDVVRMKRIIDAGDLISEESTEGTTQWSDMY